MDFNSVKEYLIEEANRLGLKEYEVYFMESSGISTETLKDEISSFSSGVGGGVSFRCIVDGRLGCASSEFLCEEEMKALVSRAVANAKSIENDDPVFFFEGSEQYATPTLPETEEVDSAKLKEIALSIQKNTYAQSDAIADGTQSGVFADQISMELLNSHGLRLSHRVSMGGAFVQAVIGKDGEAQDAFDFTLGFEEKDLIRLSENAVKEALSKLGAEEIPSGKYDVIISGKEMRSLLSAYASVFSAKNAQLGLSLLAKKEGEQVAAPCVTLVDDPMREDCPMQTPFDGEGVATYRKNVIEGGVLNTLLYDLTTAKKEGKESTANGQRVSYSDSVSIRPYSFYIQGGDLSADNLKQCLGDGLYITEFKGMHAGCNAVTGDFSIESAGYTVRNGRLDRAVKSFTVAGNFFDLLKEIEALSSEVSFGIPSGFTVYGSPDVLIRGLSIAGN